MNKTDNLKKKYQRHLYPGARNHGPGNRPLRITRSSGEATIQRSLLDEIRAFVQDNAELRQYSEVYNSHEANVQFSPAYDLLRRVAIGAKQ